MVFVQVFVFKQKRQNKYILAVLVVLVITILAVEWSPTLGTIVNSVCYHLVAYGISFL